MAASRQRRKQRTRALYDEGGVFSVHVADVPFLFSDASVS